jgi:DNA polymerase-1
MISSDLDMLQIVDYNTRLYALKRGFSDIEEFDIPALEQKYGIRQNQFLDLKALSGDSSDNIPGVPGIGQKTAVVLLQEYDNLDNIFAHTDEIKPAWSKKLREGKDLAYISKKLGQIQFDAPVKLDLMAMDVKNCDAQKVYDELSKLEFKSLLRRLPESMKSAAVETPLAQDTPGAYFMLPNKKVVANDAKVLCKRLLLVDEPLPEIEFDTRIAGFLLGRIQPAGDETEIHKLYVTQKAKLKEMPKLNKLAHELDFPLQPLLARIENHGVRIDVDGLSKMSNELSGKIKKVEQEIFGLAGQEFNIASPQQLSTILFNKLMLPTSGIKRNRNGYSTGKRELDKLVGLHPVIEKITEFRELSKIKNTYVDALPKLVDENSYLHTTLHQDVTTTGRLSSTDPNLQNIPIRSELGSQIRQYFIASPGKVLISADYSQFELRLAATLAGDQKIIETFNSDDIDIHTQTAAEVYNISPADVTSKQRRNAKVINFSVLYGTGPHSLAAVVGISYSEAKNFIERYFALHKPIRDYLDGTIKKAEEDGYVETFFGRRRPTPNVRAGNFTIREAAKRAAANMPIQGTEADLMKMAMLKIDDELGDIAPQILQIHDSIMVECDPGDVKKVSIKLKEIMENIYPKIGVRLKVDVKSGKNWGEL